MERLDGQVQRYAWGDTTTIPHLLGRNPTGEPAAELWMGAHDRAPSRLSSGDTLDQVIAADPINTLGDAVATSFGQLPYLFKVLAIASPLSIQVHPSLTQATAGFARENERGVDLGAPDRTYRDANHKPELIVALTPFEALCGFREIDSTRDLIDELGLARSDVDELVELSSRLRQDGSANHVLSETVGWMLRLGEDAACRLVRGLSHHFDTVQTSPEFASTVGAIAAIAGTSPSDPGVGVALLLNYLRLEPGEGIFLAAGNMHAYLHGVGVELMANSDNVVRGGLTPKNIDIDELMSVCSFEPEVAPIQTADSLLHRFASPVSEFSLTRVELDGHDVVVSETGPRIVLMTDGLASFDTAVDSLTVERGAIVFVPDAEGPLTMNGHGMAWVAAPGSLG